MVVKGLTAFMLQIPNIWKPCKLYDSTVIVDGNSLILFLYRARSVNYKHGKINSRNLAQIEEDKHGGEYQKYYDSISKFLSRLLECKIKPIVVIDGGYEKTVREQTSEIALAKYKLKDVIYINKHERHSSTLFPLLLLEVFYSVLVEYNIDFVIRAGETDNQVAFLSNYKHCPIISTDSDFFILDAQRGFIHLGFIDLTVNSEKAPDGKIRNFLNCKIYYINEFVRLFPGLDKRILPLFATLVGNDYVSSKIFKNYLSDMQIPKYKGKKLCFKTNKQKKMAGILCWLQNKRLKDTVNKVVTYFEMTGEGHRKSVIENSVTAYKMIPYNLLSMPVCLYLRHDIHLNRRITTPCGKMLPKNFILKYRASSRFFIKVIALHKVVLMPQIDDIELPSSHECAFYIRRIMYGILVRHSHNNTECRNQKCIAPIEEYDRVGEIIQKKQVEPCYSVNGRELLPTVDEVHRIGKTKCIAILSEALCVGSDFFNDIPEVWKLLFASINYWLRNSRCRSDAFVSAVILNLIYFGMIEVTSPFRFQKRCLMRMTRENSCNCATISCIGANVELSDLMHAERMLTLHRTIRSNSDRRAFLIFTHNFSQLKSCILHAIYLNSLLNNHLKSPDPAKCFSGIMLFNLTNCISSITFPELFIEAMIGNQLNMLFNALKSKICVNT